MRRPPTPALTICRQTPRPPTRTPHSHKNLSTQAKHTKHGATSLSVTWQLNDERRMEIRRLLLLFNMVSTIHPSAIAPAEPQDNDPMHNNDPTNANNHPCIKLTAHARKRPPTHGNEHHARRQSPTHEDGHPHTKTVAHAQKRLPMHENEGPCMRRALLSPTYSCRIPAQSQD